MKNKNGEKGDNSAPFPVKINIKLFFISLLALTGIFLLPKTAWLSTITSEKIIELTNEERKAGGLNTLTANQLLEKAAHSKAQEIVASQEFAHNIKGKKFSDWIKEAGYLYSYAGENLAIDFITSEGVLEAWNNSPSHKKNLLNPYYTEIGVAIAKGNFQNKNSILVVQIFGLPASAAYPLSSLNQSIWLPAVRGAEENKLTHSLGLPAQSEIEMDNNKFLNFSFDFGEEAVNKFLVQRNNLSLPAGPAYRTGRQAGLPLINILIFSLMAYFYFYYFLRLYQLTRR